MVASVKDADLSDVFTKLERIQVDLAERRERNRALMREHMPDCLVLIDQLKAEGMFGRVTKFEITRAV